MHKRDESAVVRALKKMSHLVNDNVFETSARLFRQIGVEADRGIPSITASPLRFHPLHEESLHLHSH